VTFRYLGRNYEMVAPGEAVLAAPDPPWLQCYAQVQVTDGTWLLVCERCGHINPQPVIAHAMGHGYARI